jgi:protoheme IX farnesyltransferase
MAPLAIVPSFIGMTSLAYGVVIGLAGAVFVGLSLKLLVNGSDKTAMQLFGYSILYLFLVFLGLVIDRFAAVWVGV